MSRVRKRYLADAGSDYDRPNPPLCYSEVCRIKAAELKMVAGEASTIGLGQEQFEFRSSHETINIFNDKYKWIRLLDESQVLAPQFIPRVIAVLRAQI